MSSVLASDLELGIPFVAGVLGVEDLGAASPGPVGQPLNGFDGRCRWGATSLPPGFRSRLHVHDDISSLSGWQLDALRNRYLGNLLTPL
jgi:hypothetical protein